MNKNIFPDRDKFLERKDKELLLKQKGIVVWFTGLSGSGKSTLALNLERILNQRGILTQVLDGDKVRSGLNKDLGFSGDDRIENIRRIAEVSKLFCECGFVVLSAFISPTHSIRQMAQEIIGADDYFEVYVSTPLAVCEQRDIKGLYQKARDGAIKDFTGISAPFDAPRNPAVALNTGDHTIDASIDIILEKLLPAIQS